MIFLLHLFSFFGGVDNKWEGVDISKIIINWGGGGANKLKRTEKNRKSLIDPPTIREGRVQKQKKTKRLCGSSINIPNPVNILSAEITWSVLEFKTLNIFLENF